MRYEPEYILVQKMQTGEYGWKEYIFHHSRALNDEYERYCQLHGIHPEEEASAIRYHGYARNANGRVAMGLHGYRVGEYGRVAPHMPPHRHGPMPYMPIPPI